MVTARYMVGAWSGPQAEGRGGDRIGARLAAWAQPSPRTYLPAPLRPARIVHATSPRILKDG